MRTKSNRVPALILIVVALTACYGLWLAAGAPDAVSDLWPATDSVGTNGPRPTRTLVPTRTPRPGRTPSPEADPGRHTTPLPAGSGPKVGVVAGHWKYDSGAVCDDGLQEVQINLDVASKVVAILQDEGYNAELLSEFDDRLTGYEADAFVSIHSDSCVFPDASGFKAARVNVSAIPEVDDALLECMIREYGKKTGLTLHENTITYDMTEYHAFLEIHPNTPAVIIELGFLGADRKLLTEHSYEVALGVVRGIECFLAE